MVEPVVRQATTSDLAFLVEAAIEADKSGGARSSYVELFGLTSGEAAALLREVLLEDIQGQELCISDALIAEIDGAPVAAVTAWVEGVDGMSSALAKSTLLFSLLGRERAAAARSKLELLAPLAIVRTVGCIQFESVFVQDAHRGRGLVASLFSAHTARLRSASPNGRAQILVLGSNRSARRAYEKMGFVQVAERSSDDPRLLALITDSTRILMERPLEDV